MTLFNIINYSTFVDYCLIIYRKQEIKVLSVKCAKRTFRHCKTLYIATEPMLLNFKKRIENHRL